MSQIPVDSVENEGAEPTPNSQSADYFLAAQFRRALLWAISGTFLIVVFGLGVARWEQRPVQAPQVLIALLLPALMLGWSLPYFGPRLRVDPSGIARRTLSGWDLWPWEDFAEGKICLGESSDGLEYRYVVEGFLPRRLQLGLLEPSDAELLNRLIRQVWVPPPPPPLPKSIQARSSWPNRFRIDLDKDRLTIHQRNETTSFCWDEIVNVEIWRNEHIRADFTELFISLPGREQPVHVRGELLNGVPKEEFVGFLCRQMSADRLHVFALHGEARSRDEVTARIKRFDSRVLVFRRDERIVTTLLLASFGGMFVLVGPKAVFVLFLPTLILLGLKYLIPNSKTVFQAQRAKLEELGRGFGGDAREVLECPGVPATVGARRSDA